MREINTGDGFGSCTFIWRERVEVDSRDCARQGADSDDIHHGDHYK